MLQYLDMDHVIMWFIRLFLFIANQDVILVHGRTHGGEGARGDICPLWTGTEIQVLVLANPDPFYLFKFRSGSSQKTSSGRSILPPYGF